MDYPVAAIVHLDSGARFGGSGSRRGSNRYGRTETPVELEQHLTIGRRWVNRARGRRLHETEGAEIALALPRGGAGHAFGPEALGIGAEQHGADRHANPLVVALGEGVDRERLGVNSVQTMLGRFLA